MIKEEITKLIKEESERIKKDSNIVMNNYIESRKHASEFIENQYKKVINSGPEDSKLR